jgi:hypothetical protein
MTPAAARAFALSAVVAATLPVAASAAAQTARTPGQLPAPDRVVAVGAMLRSDDAREQAWGAHYAGSERLAQLVPDLQQLILSRVNDQSSQASFAAVAIAVDALIQMKPSVPDLLPALYERRPVDALILASISAPEGRSRFLLDVLQTAEAELWFSAANLLLQDRSPALAPALLRALRLQVKVYLVDEGSAGGAGGGGISIGCGGSGMAEGLPPWPAYDLSTFGNSGWTVVAPGPVPVYYRRIVAPAGQTPAFCDSSTGGPTPAHHVEYLAALAQISPENLAVRGIESHSIPTGAPGGDEAEIARIKADVARRYARLLRMLVSAKVLDTSAAARYEPVIDLEVENRRTRR